jgi:hypothetical protein
MTIRELINNKDYQGIRQALSNDPNLANQGLPYDEVNIAEAHPLHRICDGVFSNKYTDEEAVEMAKIFLQHGANVNGNEMKEKQDTPLIAAASLHADKVGMLYIEHGADINHAGCHGGTALHWAAWCGRDKFVNRLIDEGAELHKLCIDFKSTPIFWAVHGIKNGNGKNIRQHFACVRILIEAGADKTIPNASGQTVFDLLDDTDIELKEILN